MVTLINGVDAATFIQDTIDAAGFNQDKDAQYNTMFYSAANSLVLGTPATSSAVDVSASSTMDPLPRTRLPTAP